jgi:phytoene desaturase
MGPSWYWMPDVFDRYFENFGYQTSDFYKLERLDPSYSVVWGAETWKIPSGTKALGQYLETIETGAAAQLDLFIEQAGKKYAVAMGDLVNNPSLNWLEFANLKMAKSLVSMDLFSNMKKHVAKYFKHPKIQQLFEFPVLFLGASASQIPALYSLMNYADVELGTWYPAGGFREIAKAMEEVAKLQGVQFRYNEAVTHFTFNGSAINEVHTNKGKYQPDLVLSGADYQFTETLLPPALQSYTAAYWDSRVMAPSCLIFYIGLNTKLPDSVLHHTLFFDADFEKHNHEIYQNPKMPSDPLFYMCCPSKTDSSVAPADCENLFLLIPIAAGLNNDEEAVREHYFNAMVTRIQQQTGVDIRENIIHKRSYCTKDFITDYHSFKGNAYGLANTLMQTAILKPKIKSKKVSNLYFTGQLTVPGPGVPPSIISGAVVAEYISKNTKNQNG